MNPELPGTFSVDPPALLLLCELILFTVLAVFVYFHNRRARENRLMALLLLLMAAALIPAPLNARLRLMPAYWVYASIPLASIAITVFLFLCLTLTRPDEKINRLYYLAFLPAVYLTLYEAWILMTPEELAKFAAGVEFSGRRILRRPPLNAATFIYTSFLVGAGGYSLWILGRAALRETDPDNRARIRFVLLTALLYFPITLIANNFLPLLGNERYRDFAILTNFSAPLVVTYSILRHKAWKMETLLDELREKQKLESSLNRAVELDRIKTNFFTNVSHDLRTPLTLIIAPLEKLLARSGDGFTPNLRRDLERIHGGAVKLSSLVNDLLDFSRAEAGAMTMRREAADLTALVRETADEFVPLATARGLKMEVALPDGPLPVLLDSAKTERALMNLISNALKFTREGHVGVRLAWDDEFVRIAVEDTGRGVPVDRREHIFRKYERLPQDEHEAGGTGIGLALAREFMELQGGDISLAPRPGGGSVFTLRLPRMPADPRAIVARERSTAAKIHNPSPKRIAPAATSSPTGPADAPLILVVEDHPELRDFLMELLSESFQVRATGRAEEAVELFRAHGPRLVVSDIMLPGMDGLELLQKLKLEPEGARVPVILLSARSGLRDRLKGLSLEADDYIEKPFAPAELILRVQNLLRKQKAVDESLRRTRRIILDDLHDHLGARLTDLAIALERLADINAEAMGDLTRKFQVLNAGFRDWLSSLEDMDILRQDFIDGIHLILIRRYSGAGRSIEFHADHAARALSREALDENGRRNLLSILVEIATNDLRYGRGESLWRFVRDESERLLVELKTQSGYEGSGGRGTKNLRRRLELMDGVMREERAGESYRLEINLDPKNSGGGAIV